MHHETRRRRTTQRSGLNLLLAAALTLLGGLAAPDAAVAAGVLSTAQSPLRGGPDSAPGTLAARIDSTLLRRLKRGEPRDFVIEFRERADLSAAFAMDWQARGRYVHQTLRDTAERSQAAVRSALTRHGAEVESFWIKNVMVVRDGDLATLRAAAGFDQVLRIREAPRVQPIRGERPAASDAVRAVGDNIAWIGADQVWAQGTLGTGITVGVIDNGVQYTHEAVVGQYRGNLGGGAFEHDYHWYGATPEPSAFDGPHGTHVLGTILGDNRAADPALRQRIGVAPGAQWIGCNGFPDLGDPAAALLACGQFMLAPTRRDGSDPDPDQRPQVVNNSWSEGDCDGTASDYYADMVEAWVAAGLFPAFATGNTNSCNLPQPPGLATISSPASLGTAFAVGSTGNHDGAYAPHSLWGPTDDANPGLPNYPDPNGHPQLKPQVVAPGVAIRSAFTEDDHAYGTMTGTSMSTPHVVGLVALMLEAGDCLIGDYAAIGGLIMQTARPIAYDTGGEPPPGLGNVPNYATGWGEIDAPAAVNAAAAGCGPSGFLRGTVTDKTGAPIAGARIEAFVDENVRVYAAVTGADGRFVRRLPVVAGGSYTVRVSAYGYLPASEPGVLVYAGQNTVLNVSLPTAPEHTLSGRVTDAATGWPLHAKIVVSGSPLAPLWTDPVTGAYSVRLPEGTPFRFDVATEIGGYRAQSLDLGIVTTGATIDLALAADGVVCNAPGYAYAGTVWSQDFAAAALPPGWTQSSAGLGWLFGTAETLSSPNFLVPEHGSFAAANDELGEDGGWANDGRYDYLTLPPQNLVGLDRPVLRYRSFSTFDDSFGDQRRPATVEASTDGGLTWVVLDAPTRTSFVEGWTEEAVDLAPVTGANVLIRFHADDFTMDESGALGYGWAIDDVALRTGCAAPAHGGLIVGHVRDGNSGVPLDGVELRVDGGAPVRTRTSADAGVGVGFFATYAAAGASVLAAQPGAGLPAGYGDADTSAAVGDGDTVRRDLALPAGRLRLYPAGPAATLELGTTASSTFTVGNTGTLPVDFGFEGVALEEHFEDAFPPAGWNVENAGADCPWHWLDLSEHGNYAGGDGLAAIVDLYPCWDLGDIDTALITPPFDLSNSATASMGFILSLLEGADAYPRLDIEASTDGGVSWTAVFTQTHDSSGGGPGTLVELDLTPFVGHEAVRVRFRFRATPPWGWVIIDQVHLFNSISETAMLDLAPDAGSVQPGESIEVQASFDAGTVTQPGVYTLPVRIAEDTPYPFPFGEVEATMTVTPPASYGAVAGLVRGLGQCDAAPAPLTNAQITIEDGAGTTFSTHSDEQGRYRYWLEAADGPFTVTVEADEHLAQTFQVALTAGQELPRDVDLRLLAPCLALDPATVEATVAPGQSAGRLVDLLNGGPVPSGWTLRAGGDPQLLTSMPLAQTASPTPEQFISFACINPGTGFALENRYFRVFPMAGRGSGSDPALIRGIIFGVDSAQSASGTQPLTVRLHALDGEFVFANLTLLAEKTVNVADSALTRVSAAFDEPVSVDADTVLVAELHLADGNNAGNSFYPGGNTAGETAPGYHVAADCGNAEPLSYPELGFGWVHLILELDLLASDPCGAAATPVSWLSFDPASGNIEGDAIVPVTATFAAGTHAPGTYQGSACLAGDDAPSSWTVIPARLHVEDNADLIFADGFE